MSRSIRKGPFVHPSLLAKVAALNKKNAKDPIQTWSRASVILPDFVGHTFNVHNGRVFLKVYVTEDMVGHRLGEFAPTRTFRGHSSRKAEVES
ncbi:MAG: 30S ribosomal protein S19 [Planctomycetes bacterium]|nr:30S ribosomal protein S19 [Planctomycetota bacterium]